jgi:hypothetical protein
MPSSYTHLFPWLSVDKGKGFFVPCLNTEEIRDAGLKEALRNRVFDAKAKVGIRQGLMGVWFFRLPRKS